MRKDEKVPKSKNQAEKASEALLREEEVIEEVESAETEVLEAKETEAIPEAELPTVEEFKSVKDELEEIRQQADEYLDGWQRAMAEFSNYKKRVQKEQETIYQEIAGRIILGYLEILDDLERALENHPPSEDKAWEEGIELICKKFRSLLDAEGVKPIEADDKIFDPNLHEAVSQEDSDDHKSGEIIQVVQQGYMLGDRVLRPARVRVAC
ncbi:MAG: nucleotide exchange factor GrpE [Chloroflexota bacterium]